jgi:methoxymalonate biosynthesis acyl carrier protein
MSIMGLNEEAIKQRIKSYVIQTYRVTDSACDETVDLFAAGIIDSLSAADIVTFLEKEFEVRFEREHLFDKRFLCVQGMAQIIYEIKTA